MDEAYLIRAAQKGDLEAFNRLVLAYQDMAYNVAYRILADEYAAEDATQNAFISAFRNVSGYRGGSLKAWFMRIVTNACYDELRSRKRRPTIPLEPVDDESNEEIESPRWLADDGPSPEEFAERSELEQAIQNCLDQLPEDFKVAIVMVDFQGSDYQEVSNVIRIPLGTVKSRIARARLRMKDCLKEVRELLPLDLRLEGEEDG